MARAEMSPFGSMAMTGIPLSAASSMMALQKTAFPDPVAPNTTACLVRTAGSMSSDFPSESFPTRSPVPGTPAGCSAPRLWSPSEVSVCASTSEPVG